jgi:crotonobetainyl-CoA:carnitine CoA-transferase CaiB-like acyl-CoA transferase
MTGRRVVASRHAAAERIPPGRAPGGGALQRPLDGIRVVEIAHYVAVPAAGALLADLGAEVVKVEQPPRGEIYRRSRPRFAGYATEFPESPPFHMDNRGKRSIALDLGDPDARGALGRIIAGADVVTTNLLPARRVRYGLDHETLLARQPQLIYAAISGYGHGGEEADTPAFDYTAYWARTGLMDTSRDEGVPPSMLRPAVGDHAAAVNLVCGILSALRLRDATGAGRYVEVSLLGTGLHIFGTDIATALVTREPVHRHDRKRPLNPLWNSYPVAGDRWLLLVMIDADRYWGRLCRAIGRADLEHDPRFGDGFARAQNSALLTGILEDVFSQATLDAWRPRLDAEGLIWSPVNRADEAIADPQARAMGYFVEIEHESAGRFESVAPPFRLHGVDLGASRAASACDADAVAILGEAGLSTAEIEKLKPS